MAVARRGTEASPERTKVWTETAKPKKKVAVVYYLSRNGQLEHPHFMEVALSSRDGLYLKDVINRLNFLRGKGMATLYSWSSKRCYKNGFVWHDLSEDDFIYPAHGQEYVLKGSELLLCSSSSPTLEERKKTPWSSLDLGEYKIFKNEKAADAATQTDGERRQRSASGKEQDEEDDRGQRTTELGCDGISPPPSSSSTETLDSLTKSDGSGAGGCHSGRLRASASAVLMHLISCGAISVKDRGGGMPLQTRGGATDNQEKEMDGVMGMPSFSGVRLEAKEYFSGSLIETKKKGYGGNDAAAAAGLKRSSSYNAERSSRMEMDVVGGRCIPARKTKGVAREGNTTISRSALGSKRFEEEIN